MILVAISVKFSFLLPFDWLIDFWLHWVFIGACWLSLGVASGGYFLVEVHGLLTAVASLAAEHKLWVSQASVAVAHGLWGTGTIAVVHGLSCSAPRGIFLDQGWNLRLLYWQANSLSLNHQGSPSVKI